MNQPSARAQALRALCLVAVVAAGLAGIVGSTGGAIGFPPCDPSVCTPTPLPPTAEVQPLRTVVQVAGTASFSASAANLDGPLAYQWRRRAGAAGSWAVIPGASGPTLSLAGLNLADDGTEVQVQVSGAGGRSAVAEAQVLVSATPGVVFEDTEGADAHWQASPGPQVQQQADGGHPGAWRRMVDTLPAGAGAAGHYHLRTDALYDPQVQGAIRAVTHAEDCLGPLPDRLSVETSLVLVQAGRRYAPQPSRPRCTPGAWGGDAAGGTLLAQDFVLVDGPACGAGETCPDFSALGPPLQLGYRRLVLGLPGDTVVHGMDNWRVTFWRR